MIESSLNSLFTDVSKITLLINTLSSLSGKGLLLTDSYYWLSPGGEKNDKIDNTLSLLIDADVIETRQQKLFLTEQMKEAIQKHSIDNSLRKFILSSIGTSTIEELFKYKFLTDDGRLALKVNSISPMYIEVRNLLINIGGFIQAGSTLVCSKIFKEVLIQKGYKYFFDGRQRFISEQELYDQLARKSELGLIAEEIAYKYELKRLRGNHKKPVLVARINTAAGYDIKSFKGGKSSDFDLFIEVKYFDNGHFFITDNEIAVAKRFGDKYCIYLVNTNTRHIKIIENPIRSLADNTVWISKVKVIEYKKTIL